jgi:hypothetical protein
VLLKERFPEPNPKIRSKFYAMPASFAQSPTDEALFSIGQCVAIGLPA